MYMLLLSFFLFGDFYYVFDLMYFASCYEIGKYRFAVYVLACACVCARGS